MEDKEQEQVQGDSTSKESTWTTTVHVEKEKIAAPYHEIQGPIEYEVPDVRWSTGTRKMLSCHLDYIIEGDIVYYLLTKDGEPSTLQQALSSIDASQ